MYLGFNTLDVVLETSKVRIEHIAHKLLVVAETSIRGSVGGQTTKRIVHESLVGTSEELLDAGILSLEPLPRLSTLQKVLGTVSILVLFGKESAAHI